MCLFMGEMKYLSISFQISPFQNEFILILTFYLPCEMCVSAYLNAIFSTNFSVSLPFSPNTLSCSFPMYPSQHCQSKSQTFVSMGEMTAKQPRITNKYLMQYNLLLLPRRLHYLTRYARDVSWGKKRANVNNLPSWHSREPNKTWLAALKEWKMKSPSSKIH